jgi:hypothetical protein
VPADSRGFLNTLRRAFRPPARGRWPRDAGATFPSTRPPNRATLPSMENPDQAVPPSHAMRTMKTRFLLAVLALLVPTWCKAQSNVYSMSVYAGGVSSTDLCYYDFPFPPHHFRLSERSWLEDSHGFTVMDLAHKRSSGDVLLRDLVVTCGSNYFSMPLPSIPPGKVRPEAGPVGERGSGDLAQIVLESARSRGGHGTTNTIAPVKTTWVRASVEVLDIIILDGDRFEEIQGLLQQAYGKPDSSCRSSAPVGNGRSLCYTPEQVGLILTLTADSRQTIISLIGRRKS